jgi:hypothetical protein
MASKRKLDDVETAVNTRCGPMMMTLNATYQLGEARKPRLEAPLSAPLISGK